MAEVNAGLIIEAIAARLKSKWPDKHVFVDQIPDDADGNFFIGVIETSYETGLWRRRQYGISFEVLYFQKARDNMAFYEWADTMYSITETLSLPDRTVHTSNAKASNGDDMVYRFTFDVSLSLVVKEPDGEPLGELLIEGVEP